MLVELLRYFKETFGILKDYNMSELLGVTLYCGFGEPREMIKQVLSWENDWTTNSIFYLFIIWFLLCPSRQSLLGVAYKQVYNIIKTQSNRIIIVIMNIYKTIA